jgi:hypothetical protein
MVKKEYVQHDMTVSMNTFLVKSYLLLSKLC